MVYEELTQVLETVADSVEPKIADAVFSKDERLQSMELLNAFDVLVTHLPVRQIDFLSVCVDHHIFYCCCLWPALCVESQHDLLQFVQLRLNTQRITFN